MPILSYYFFHFCYFLLFQSSVRIIINLKREALYERKILRSVENYYHFVRDLVHVASFITRIHNISLMHVAYISFTSISLNTINSRSSRDQHRPTQNILATVCSYSADLSPCTLPHSQGQRLYKSQSVTEFY